MVTSQRNKPYILFLWYNKLSILLHTYNRKTWSYVLLYTLETNFILYSIVDCITNHSNDSNIIFYIHRL